ncbi:uncharacterized protein LOC127283311 [Leptopilina boulardi]|uniref:uncharacterized protein LOC127283311 n=1 Tax=Leptopilina boulardi TaxID=63433 RepID=UPI0021F6366F|nr:uncharacterized protein LOC127283311 [Leptopilina boulardi]
MAEESGRPNIASRLKLNMNESPFFCKIIELILCIVSVGLIVGPFNSRLHANFKNTGLVYVAICGYVLINSIIIFCYLIGEKMPKKMSLFFTGMGAILCFAAGVILIYDWDNFENNLISQYLNQYLDQTLASGIFALLAAFVFALDVYFINKYE